MDDRRVFWEVDGKEYCDEELALARLLENDILFSNGRKYVDLKWVARDPKAPSINLSETDTYDVVDGDIQPETVVLFVGCNDVFYWACADAESLPHAEIGPLYRMWEQDNAWGPTRWCCLRRGMRPQHPVMDAMRKAGSWTPDLQALPPRSGADACGCEYCTKDTEPRL